MVKVRREAIEAGGAAFQAALEGRRRPWPQFRCPQCASTWYSAETPFVKTKRSDGLYCSRRWRTRAWRR
jgi:hypothetical protein